MCDPESALEVSCAPQLPTAHPQLPASRWFYHSAPFLITSRSRLTFPPSPFFSSTWRKQNAGVMPNPFHWLSGFHGPGHIRVNVCISCWFLLRLRNWQKPLMPQKLQSMRGWFSLLSGKNRVCLSPLQPPPYPRFSF